MRFGFTEPGGSSYSLELLPATVRRGREVWVQWAFDTDTERVDLSLDGHWLASKTFAGGLDKVFAASAVSNFATTASWLIDDVQAQAVPEPAARGVRAGRPGEDPAPAAQPCPWRQFGPRARAASARVARLPYTGQSGGTTSDGVAVDGLQRRRPAGASLVRLSTCVHPVRW